MQASQPTGAKKKITTRTTRRLKKVNGRAFRTLAEREFKFQGRNAGVDTSLTEVMPAEIHRLQPRAEYYR